MEVREYIQRVYNEFLNIKRPYYSLNFTIVFIGEPMLVPKLDIQVNRNVEKI